MNISELRTAISNGRRVYGTLIVSTSPHWPGQIKQAGLDFVFIDTEHVSLDREILSWMCRTYGALGIAPIVRIPSPDPFAALQALDGGAAGIVAPYVERVEQVQSLVGATKFKPLKGKRLENALAGQEQLEPRLQKYLADRNRDNMLLVNIESTPAMENLDPILSVHGLDGILVGPHDLSCSLGIPEQYEHQRFEEALRIIAGKARDHALIAGVHFIGCGPLPRAVKWIRMGFNLLIQQGDLPYVVQGVRADLQAIRRVLGEESFGSSEEVMM